jgi:hypothetical protein
MALVKHSPKMTANCALAMALTGGIFHSFGAVQDQESRASWRPRESAPGSDRATELGVQGLDWIRGRYEDAGADVRLDRSGPGVQNASVTALTRSGETSMP